MSFFNRLTRAGKIVVTLLFLGVLFGFKWILVDSGWILSPSDTKSQNVGQLSLPDSYGSSNVSNVAQFPMPGSVPASLSGEKVNFLLWAWNAQMGLMFANGGAQTTQGSLMEKYGVNLNLIRQDDVPQMQQSLLKAAQEYKSDGRITSGAHFVAIMGDGSAAFLQGINPELKKLGDEYIAQVVYSSGKSLGEDKFMGKPEWKEDPQKARGAVVTAVLRDGDWNIVVKWAGDNNIPVNPSEKTYDPDAINFIAADTYIDASQKYINGYSEDREVVKDGKKTGQTQKVYVNGVTTWTPGDVMVAEKKGGLVSIVSTKEYRAQMPNVIIGIKKWMQDHRPTVENMIRAIAAGGDQVKSYPDALKKAGEISAKVYNEESGDYWVKYYKGLTKTDKSGMLVELGGSRVHNLADNLELFGLASGGTNIFSTVYKKFGDVVVKLYPNLISTYPPADEILDVSYLKNVAEHESNLSPADMPKFQADENISQKVSQKSWSIPFETGSASFSPSARQELDELFDDLVISSGLKVEIHGHTDNVGNPESNMELSRRRAEAIKNWLRKKSSSNFPDSRIAIVPHGQQEPIGSNDTPGGRAQNRRVDIVMGN